MDTSELEAAYRPVLDLAGRLDEAQAATRLPVSGLLVTQARAHLPMHQRQLSELLGLP